MAGRLYRPGQGRPSHGLSATTRLLLLGMGLGGAACASLAPRPDLPRCPPPTQEQGERTAALRGLLAQHDSLAQTLSMGLRICYQPGQGRGVVSGGLVLLDPSESDAELAAQLSHLCTHVEDGLGDGCARGIAAARASEEQARSREDRLRQRLMLPLRGGPAAADADYARRCPAR